MGNAQSANCSRLFLLLHSSPRYHKLSNSSALLSQPLLKDENLSMEIADEVQANWERTLALEKEIHGLKSNFFRLETKVQTNTSKAKAIEGEKQEAIPSLELKVDKLKSLVMEIIGHEADKLVYSAEFSNQGLANKRVEEKNIEVEKEIAELKTRVNDIAFTMTEMAAVIDDLKLKSLLPREAPKSTKASMPDKRMTISKFELHGFFMILIFLISVLLGMNL